MKKNKKFYLIVASLISIVLTALANSPYSYWLIMWLAPIPLLIACQFGSFRHALYSGFLIGLAMIASTVFAQWHSPLSHYLLVPATLIAGCIYAAVFGLFNLMFRVGPNVLKVLAFPCLVVTAEWLSAFYYTDFPLNIAYSQWHLIMLTQISAITGIYGVTFLISLFASGAAIAIAQFKKRHLSAPALLITVALLLGAFIVNFTQTIYSVAPTTIPIGMVSLPQTHAERMSPALAIKQLHRALPAIEKLAASGAKLILLPEQYLTINDTNKDVVYNFLRNVAHLNHVDLAVGINSQGPHSQQNIVDIYNAKGEHLGRYKKQNLSYRDKKTLAGHQLALLNIGNVKLGVAIGEDINQPQLARAYGKQGINILLVSALDHGNNHWQQAVPGIFRGIENGNSVIRNAQNGWMSVSSISGVVLSREKSDTAVKAVLWNVEVAHFATVYTQYGNFLPWLCLVIVLLWLAIANKRLLPQKNPPETDPMSGRLGAQTK